MSLRKLITRSAMTALVAGMLLILVLVPASTASEQANESTKRVRNEEERVQDRVRVIIPPIDPEQAWALCSRLPTPAKVQQCLDNLICSGLGSADISEESCTPYAFSSIQSASQ